MTGRRQPEPTAHKRGTAGCVPTPGPSPSPRVESTLVCDPQHFPSPPLISYFPSCPGPRLVFLLGCVTIPGCVWGVFCWQRPVPPLTCMDRLAYPGAHLNREGSIPRLTRTQGSQDQGQREKLEPQGPRKVRAVGQEKPASQEGALLWAGQMGSLIKAPRGSMEEGDGQERGRKVLVLVLSQRHGGEVSAQALTFSCLPVFPNISSK